MKGLNAGVIIGIAGMSLALGWHPARGNELYEAVRAGNAAAVSDLIAGGAAIDELDYEGSPLHIAVLRGDAELAAALLPTRSRPASRPGPVPCMPRRTQTIR